MVIVLTIQPYGHFVSPPKQKGHGFIEEEVTLKSHLLLASAVAFMAVLGSAVGVGAQPQTFVAHFAGQMALQN